jgi:hypothetical protein
VPTASFRYPRDRPFAKAIFSLIFTNSAKNNVGPGSEILIEVECLPHEAVVELTDFGIEPFSPGNRRRSTSTPRSRSGAPVASGLTWKR